MGQHRLQEMKGTDVGTPWTALGCISVLVHLLRAAEWLPPPPQALRQLGSFF